MKTGIPYNGRSICFEVQLSLMVLAVLIIDAKVVSRFDIALKSFGVQVLECCLLDPCVKYVRGFSATGKFK